MRHSKRLAMALLASALAPAAMASETITYSYDARGRLVNVLHTGAVNSNLATSYSYDHADNRVQQATASVPPPPSFSIANASAVTEGGTLVFTVTKTGSTSSTYSVDYATGTGGTATPGSDFTATSGTLTFGPSDITKTFNVVTIDDAAVESSETVQAALSAPTGGATITAASASGTINDNDAVNHPPTTVNDTKTLVRCVIGSLFNVGANDSDIDGDLPLTVISVTNFSGLATVVPSSGSTVEIETGPTAGTSVHYYTIQDSRGATAVGTLTITISGGVPSC